MRRPLVAGLAFVAVSFSSVARAQITNVTAEQAPPVPGAGHDYIKLFSETVNPGTGSVSIRIEGPVAKGRELTVPFSIGYDSNSSMHTFVSVNPAWTDNSEYLGQGGWSYSLPFLSISAGSRVVGPNGGPPGQGGNTTCRSYTNYMFGDVSGSVHGFQGVATAIDVEDPQVVCQVGGFQSYLTGADSQIVESAIRWALIPASRHRSPFRTAKETCTTSQMLPRGSIRRREIRQPIILTTTRA